MRIEQLQIFQTKESFLSQDFESESNALVFKKIAESVSGAFNRFSSQDITDFDSTTRSNMLNNLVVRQIERDCQNERFKFIPALTNTRRSFAILNDRYILFFKKSPVSNVKTDQDDSIKNQQLDKHIIFVVYSVDDIWSSLTKLEFQYFSAPNSVSYKYDISKYLNHSEGTITIPTNTEKEVVPSVTLKKDKIISKAQ